MAMQIGDHGIERIGPHGNIRQSFRLDQSLHASDELRELARIAEVDQVVVREGVLYVPPTGIHGLFERGERFLLPLQPAQRTGEVVMRKGPIRRTGDEPHRQFGGLFVPHGGVVIEKLLQQFLRQRGVGIVGSLDVQRIVDRLDHLPTIGGSLRAVIPDRRGAMKAGRQQTDHGDQQEDAFPGRLLIRHAMVPAGGGESGS
jgi:hypothetical protein